MKFFLCKITVPFFIVCFLLSSNLQSQISIASYDFPPYSISHSLHSGILGKIISKIFHKLQESVTLTFLSLPHALNETQKKHYVGMYPFITHLMNDENFYLSDSILSFEVYLYKLKNTHIEKHIQKTLHFKAHYKYRVCVPSKFATKSILRKLEEQKYTYAILKYAQDCFYQLNDHRFDYVVESPYNEIDNAATSLTNDSFVTKAFPEPLLTGNMTFATPKSYENSEKLIGLFNTKLNILKQNGTLDDIQHEYKSMDVLI